MDHKAADAFLSWLSDNSTKVVAKCAELQNPETAARAQKDGAKEFRRLFASLEQEIAPLLEEVEEGLVFEVGPGTKKKYGLIISAGGVSQHIEAVKYLASHAPEMPDLEVIAFKPARPLSSDSKQVIQTPTGTLELGPDDIRFALTPELTKIDLSLYFPNYSEEANEIFGTVGFNYLDFSLGEYTVMESVGGIEFGDVEDAEGQTFPVTELASRFEAAKQELRRAFSELQSASPDIRFSKRIAELSKAIDEINEAVSEDESEEATLGASVWTASAPSTTAFEEQLPGFEVRVEPSFSLVGDGHTIHLSGPAKNSELKIENWLRSFIQPVIPTDGVLLDVAIVEGMDPAMATFVASALVEQERYQEAIRLLKPTVAKIGGKGNGTLQALLGSVYLEVGEFDNAIEVFNLALEVSKDSEFRADIISHRGVAQQRLGRIAEALESFEKARELEPGKAMRHYNVAQAYALLGNPQPAISAATRALEIDSDILKQIESDDDLKSLREDEGFKAVMQKYQKSGLGLGKALKSLFSRA